MEVFERRKKDLMKIKKINHYILEFILYNKHKKNYYLDKHSHKSNNFRLRLT